MTDTRAPTTKPMGTSAVGPVRIRPLAPGEAGPVVEVFDGLGEDARRSRFLVGIPRLTGFVLEMLTSIDDRDHIAVVAEDAATGRSVGIAHLMRDARDRRAAEVAVSVVDRWQRHGVGTRLVTALAERAGQLAIDRLTLVMLAENRAALRLARHIPGQLRRVEVSRGLAEYVVLLPDGTPRDELGQQPGLVVRKHWSGEPQ